MTRGLAALVLLAACAGPPIEEPHVRELRLASAVGREAFTGGDLGVAEASFARALDLARMLDDPRETGNAASDLAAVLAEREGPGDRSAALLDEARAAFARSGDAAARVEADLLSAEILLASGDRMSAAWQLDQLPQGLAPLPSARAHLLRVELARTGDDAAGARQEFAAACTALGEDPAAPKAPTLQEALGRILELEGKQREAADAYGSAAEGYRARGLLRRMAHGLQSEAVAASAAGDQARAIDRSLRAASALLAMHDNHAAWEAAGLAASTADKIDDTAAKRRALQLRERAGG